MRAIKVIMMLTLVSILVGCQKTSIKEAQDIANAEKAKPVQDTKLLNEQKQSEKESKKAEGSSQTVDAGPFTPISEEISNTVNIVNLGETVKYGNFSMCIDEVLLVDNIFQAADFTDEETFERLKEHIMYGNGPESRLAQETGKINIQADGSSDWYRKFMILKVRFYNDSSSENELIVQPEFYGANYDNKYILQSITRIGMDKWKTEPPNQSLYKIGGHQEEELIIAIAWNNELKEKEIFMEYGFLARDFGSKRIKPGMTLYKILG